MRNKTTLKRRTTMTAAAVAAAAALVAGGATGAAAAPAQAVGAVHVSPHTATTATLVGAQITFHSGSDGKDSDTLVEVDVNDQYGSLAATQTQYWGYFPDYSDNGPYSLTVKSGVTSAQLNGGKVHIHITPNGNDTWWFGYTLTLYFSDGTQDPINQTGCVLSESGEDGYYGFVY